MSTKKNPTLSDIYDAQMKISQEQGAQSEQLKQIHTQTLKTNGRVTKLEEWKGKADVIADYLEKHPSVEKGVSNVDWQGLVKTLLGLLATALAIIGTLAATGKLK